jgi:hypothetical protein
MFTQHDQLNTSTRRGALISSCSPIPARLVDTQIEIDWRGEEKSIQNLLINCFISSLLLVECIGARSNPFQMHTKSQLAMLPESVAPRGEIVCRGSSQ